MQKQAPTLPRLLTMVLFALSCFGLLLFLWLAFGGPVPLKPQGLSLRRRLPRGDAARRPRPTCGSPACRSARSTGKDITPTRQPDRSRQSSSSRSRAAALRRQGDPASEDAARRDVRRADARAPTAPHDPGERLARRRQRPPTVSSTRSSRRSTRSPAGPSRPGSRTSPGVDGRGQDLNDALGNLPRFVASGGDVLAVLDAQSAARAPARPQHRRDVRAR